MSKQEESFTKVPNIILDDSSLNIYERAILIHVARRTIGFGKESDGISLSQFQKATGMGVSKVKMVINTLKEKKLIKVKRQTKKDGGKSYNRYSLTHSHDMTNHSHEVANPKPCGDHGHSHEVAIQKKIEQKKIDKRRERQIYDNIFFSLTDHERTREANAYADFISVGASNREAYKVKINKQINKEHKETLDAFQDWYFTKTCEALTRKYAGRSVDDYEIESVYPYTNTKGYDDSSYYEVDHIFYVQGRNAKGKTKTLGADSSKEMEELLEYMTKETQ